MDCRGKDRRTVHVDGGIRSKRHDVIGLEGIGRLCQGIGPVLVIGVRVPVATPRSRPEQIARPPGNKELKRSRIGQEGVGGAPHGIGLSDSQLPENGIGEENCVCAVQCGEARSGKKHAGTIRVGPAAQNREGVDADDG